MTASTVAALPRVRVMFDVNVYLDLAQLFQVAPADLSASFGQALRRFSDLGVYPHPCYRDDNRPIDSLRATALACGVGLSADSGPTSVVAGGELVFGALITGGQPLSVTPGSSQGVPFITNAFNGSRSADTQAIYVGEAGAQNARFVLGQNMDWYAAVSTFRPAP